MVRPMQIQTAAHLVARLEEKSVRRPWREELHPRDSKGRFIETGGVARLWGGGMARVLKALGGRNVLVENLSTRERSTINASRLTMVARPDGSAPTRSKKKVRDEDQRRDADARRGTGLDTEDAGDHGDTPDDVHTHDDEGNHIGWDDVEVDHGAGPEPHDDEPDAQAAPASRRKNPNRRFKTLDDVRAHWASGRLMPFAQDRTRQEGHNQFVAQLMDKIDKPQLSRNGHFVIGRMTINRNGREVTGWGITHSQTGVRISLTNRKAEAVHFANRLETAQLDGKPIDWNNADSFARLNTPEGVKMANRLAAESKEAFEARAAKKREGANARVKPAPPTPTSPEQQAAQRVADRTGVPQQNVAVGHVGNEPFGDERGRPRTSEELREFWKRGGSPDTPAAQRDVLRKLAADPNITLHLADHRGFAILEHTDRDDEYRFELRAAGTGRTLTRLGPRRLHSYGNFADRETADRFSLYLGSHLRDQDGHVVDWGQPRLNAALNDFRDKDGQSADVAILKIAGEFDRERGITDSRAARFGRPRAERDEQRQSPPAGTPVPEAGAPDGEAVSPQSEPAASDDAPDTDAQVAEALREAAKQILPVINDIRGLHGDDAASGLAQQAHQVVDDHEQGELPSSDAVQQFQHVLDDIQRATRGLEGRENIYAQNMLRLARENVGIARQKIAEDRKRSKHSGVRGSGSHVLADVPPERGGEDGRGRPGEVRGGSVGGDSGRDSGSGRRPGAEAGGGDRRGDAGGADEAGPVRREGAGSARDGVRDAEGARDGDEGHAEGDPALAGRVAFGSPEQEAEAPSFRPPANGETLAPSTPLKRAEANIAAIEILHRLEQEQRPATPEEQQALARWSGWGAVPQIFKPKPDEKFAPLQAKLRELLSDDEWREARANTKNAHYTDPKIVQQIWAAVAELGFTDGDVLEPGSGSGNFIGYAPDGAHVTGVELDPITARISKALYPHAEIRNESFGTTRAPNGTFDVSVGNVPFGNYRVTDLVHNKGGYSVHNHFILKSLDLTRPGGLVAVVTSSLTMDGHGKKAEAARMDMASKGELVAAIRLPSGAHQRTAGTNVVTDLLIFRRREQEKSFTSGRTRTGDVKRLSERGPKDPPMWVHSLPRLGLPGQADPDRDENAQPVFYNSYFHDHPEQVLGTMSVGHGLNRADELRVDSNGDPIRNLNTALKRAVAQAQQDGLTYEEHPDGRRKVELLPPGSSRVDGHVQAESDGTFTQVRDGMVHPFHVPKTQADEARRLLAIRDTFQSLLAEESRQDADESLIERLRTNLNEQYEAYQGKYGAINRFTWAHRTVDDPTTGEKVKKAYRKRAARGGLFRYDPTMANIAALDEQDDNTGKITRAAIFGKRQGTFREIPKQADDPQDALAVVLDRDGKLTPQGLADVMGVEEKTATARLLAARSVDPDTEVEYPLAFQTPDGELVPTADYLSGNVRRKLAAARDAAIDDPRFEVNVDHLERVVPPDLSTGEIAAPMGASWIGREAVEEFLRRTFNSQHITVSWQGGALWAVDAPDSVKRQVAYATRDTWSVPGYDALKIAEAILTNRKIRVTIKTKEGTLFDPEATADAEAKAEQLKEEFTDWLWADADRAEHYKRLYNDAFNSMAPRSYDGQRRTIPGLVEWFTPHPHQHAAVARMVNEPSVLLAHEVGAGKTAEMAMGVMELRRLGLINKAAIVVPGHMLDQFRTEFAELFPESVANNRILTASSDDLSGNGRREFIARAASGDYDAIILTQTAFESIQMRPDVQENYVRQRLEKLEEKIRKQKALDGEDNDTRLVKRMENQLSNLQAKLEKKLQGLKDEAGLNFEDMGVDYLVVDEAHMYKNLYTPSSIDSVAIEGSNRASDLDMKLEWLRGRSSSGRVVTFATATPVANSIAEVHTMLRYLRPDLLEQTGLQDFDDFASTFAQAVAAIERSADGSYSEKTRLAAFQNVPELMRLWRAFADVKTSEDLDLPVPAVAGGKAVTITMPQSEAQVDYEEKIKARAARLAGGNVDPREDNYLKLLSDGRAAALDPRLVDPDAGPGNKLPTVADNIKRIYEQTKDTVYPTSKTDSTPHETPGGLQIVFLDLGTPKDPGRTKKKKKATGDGDTDAPADTEAPAGEEDQALTDFSTYDELKKLLIARGIPSEKIRFIHDAKDDAAKARLFHDARTGRIAVLLGSTFKMGTGTNVQLRATALHHVDAPWRPADVEQRNGRIIRQGNANPEVAIFQYATELSTDAKFWEAIARKAKFIRQLMRGSLNERVVEDIGEIKFDADEASALVAGDPHLIAQAQLKPIVKRLRARYNAYQRSQEGFKRTIQQAADAEGSTADTVAALNRALERRKVTRGTDFNARIGTTDFAGTEGRNEARGALNTALRAILADGRQRPQGQSAPARTIGQVGGLDITAEHQNKWNSFMSRYEHMVVLDIPAIPGSARDYRLEDLVDVDGKAQRLPLMRVEDEIAGIDSKIRAAQDRLADKQRAAAQVAGRVGRPFELADEYEKANKQLELLNQIMRLKAKQVSGEEQHKQREAAVRTLDREVREMTGDGEDVLAQVAARDLDLNPRTPAPPAITQDDKGRTRFVWPDAEAREAEREKKREAKKKAAAEREQRRQRTPAEPDALGMDSSQLDEEITRLGGLIARDEASEADVIRHASLEREKRSRARSEGRALEPTAGAGQPAQNETAADSPDPGDAGGAGRTTLDPKRVRADLNGLKDEAEQSRDTESTNVPEEEPGTGVPSPSGTGNGPSDTSINLDRQNDGGTGAADDDPTSDGSTADAAQDESAGDQFAAVRSRYDGEMVPASDIRSGDWVHTVSADPAHNEPMHMVGRVIHVTPVLSNGQVRIEVEAHVTLNGRDTTRTEFALFRATDVVERLPEGNPGREDSSDLRRRIEASDGQRLAAKVRVPDGWQAVDGSQVEPHAGDRFRIALRQGTSDSKYWNVTVAGPAEREGYWRVEGQMFSFHPSDIVAVPNNTDAHDGDGHTPKATPDDTSAATGSSASVKQPEDGPATTGTDTGSATPKPEGAPARKPREGSAGNPNQAGGNAEPFTTDADWRRGLTYVDASENQVNTAADGTWHREEIPGGVPLLRRAVLDALAAQEDNDFDTAERRLVDAREHAAGLLDTLDERERPTMEGPLRGFLGITDDYLARHRATRDRRNREDEQRRRVEDQDREQVREMLRQNRGGQPAQTSAPQPEETRDPAPAPEDPPTPEPQDDNDDSSAPDAPKSRGESPDAGSGSTEDGDAPEQAVPGAANREEQGDNGGSGSRYGGKMVPASTLKDGDWVSVDTRDYFGEPARMVGQVEHLWASDGQVGFTVRNLDPQHRDGRTLGERPQALTADDLVELLPEGNPGRDDTSDFKRRLDLGDERDRAAKVKVPEGWQAVDGATIQPRTGDRFRIAKRAYRHVRYANIEVGKSSDYNGDNAWSVVGEPRRRFHPKDIVAIPEGADVQYIDAPHVPKQADTPEAPERPPSEPDVSDAPGAVLLSPDELNVGDRVRVETQNTAGNSVTREGYLLAAPEPVTATRDRQKLAAWRLHLGDSPDAAPGPRSRVTILRDDKAARLPHPNGAEPEEGRTTDASSDEDRDKRSAADDGGNEPPSAPDSPANADDSENRSPRQDGADDDQEQRDERSRRRNRDRGRPDGTPDGVGGPGGAGLPGLPNGGRSGGSGTGGGDRSGAGRAGRTKALRDRYRSGDVPTPSGADPAAHQRHLNDLADNDTLALSPKGSLITWSDDGGRTWQFGHAASGMHLRNWDADGNAIGGREGALRLAGAYEDLRDGNGDPIDWGAPQLDVSALRAWRGADGELLRDAAKNLRDTFADHDAPDIGPADTSVDAPDTSPAAGSAQNDQAPPDTGADSANGRTTPLPGDNDAPDDVSSTQRQGAPNGAGPEGAPGGGEGDAVDDRPRADGADADSGPSEGRDNENSTAAVDRTPPQDLSGESRYGINSGQAERAGLPGGVVDGRQVPTRKELKQYEDEKGVYTTEGEQALFGSPEYMRELASEAFVPTPAVRTDLGFQVWRDGRRIGHLRPPSTSGGRAYWESEQPFAPGLHGMKFATREAALAALVLRDKERGEPDLAMVHPDLALFLGGSAQDLGFPPAGSMRGLESLEDSPDDLERYNALRKLLAELARGVTPSGNVADDLDRLHDELKWLDTTHYKQPPTNLRERHILGPGWLAEKIGDALDVLRPEDPRADHHMTSKNRAGEQVLQEHENRGLDSAERITIGDVRRGDLVHLEGRVTDRYPGATDEKSGYVIGDPKAITFTVSGKRHKGYRITLARNAFKSRDNFSQTFIIPADGGTALRFARAEDIDMPFDEHRYGRQVDQAARTEAPSSADRPTPDSGSPDSASNRGTSGEGVPPSADDEAPAAPSGNSGESNGDGSGAATSGERGAPQPKTGSATSRPRQQREPGHRTPPAPAPKAGPEPVNGRPAEWVQVSDLAMGDLVRVDGITRNGTARTLSGYIVDGPRQIPTTRARRVQDMYRILISESPDSRDAKRESVWVHLDSAAARATKTGPEQTEGAPQSGADSDVLSGRVPERVPVDGNGNGLFPGSVVTDDDGREGVVTGATASSVRVRFGDDRSDDAHSPTSLNVTDGGAARPTGWTPDGRLVRTGNVVGDQHGSLLGTVEEVDGDTATVATPDGMKATPVAELRVLGDTDTASSGEGKVSALSPTAAGELKEGDVVVQHTPSGPRTARVTRSEQNGDRTLLRLEDTTSGEATSLDVPNDSSILRVLDTDGRAPELGPKDAPDSGDPITPHEPAATVYPVDGATVDPELSPEEREAIADHGQAPTDDPDAQQAAARLASDLPITPEQATALARSLREGSDSSSPQGRAALRAADRLDAAAGNPADNTAGRPEAGTVGAVGVGDTIALPDAADPNTLSPYRVVRIQDAPGGIRVLTLEDGDGARSERTLVAADPLYQLPELASQPDVTAEPRDPNPAPDADRLRTDYADSVVRAVIDNAVQGTVTPGSIHQLRQQIAEQLTAQALRAAMRRVRSEALDAINTAEISDDERQALIRSLRKTAARSRADAIKAAVRTLNDMEPLNGESEEDTARRAADLLRLIPDALRNEPQRDTDAGDSRVDDAVAGSVDGAVGDALQAATAGGLTEERRAAIVAQLAAQMAANRDSTAHRIAAGVPEGRRPGVFAHIVAALVVLSRKVVALVAAFLKALLKGLRKSREALRRLGERINRFRRRLVQRIKSWPESHRLRQLAARQLPNPADELDLGDRIAHWARLLPAPGRFGQVSRRARWYHPAGRAMLAGGQLPQVQDGVRWTPDRAADGGPGNQGLRHLAAVRAAGTDVDSGIARRLAAAAPELGDNPHSTVRQASDSADSAERRLRDLQAAVDAGVPDAEPELAAARVEAETARQEARRLHQAYATALPDAVLAALGEIRDMGPEGSAGLVLSPGSDPQATRVLEDIQRYIPRDWLLPAGSRFLNARSGETGSYDSASRTATVADLGDGGRATAANALLAHLQRTYPDLLAAQEAFHFTRTHTGRAGARRTSLDMLLARLFGDRLDQGSADQIVPLGLAAMFSGDWYKDDDLRAFLLGLLATR